MPTPESESICIVVLTDSLYLPGTIATVSSWDRHNPPLPLVVMSPEREIGDHPFVRERAASFHLIDDHGYADIAAYKKRKSKRHLRTFPKFEMFRDFGYNTNLFLDSDLLCLANAAPLLVSSSSPLSACLETGFKPTRSYRGSEYEINSGVMRIEKSLLGDDVVDSLRRIAQMHPGRGGYNAGDQGILNKWIRLESIELGILEQRFNLIKKDYSHTLETDGCALLHFAGSKPWFPRRKPIPLDEPLLRLWHQENDSTHENRS